MRKFSLAVATLVVVSASPVFAQSAYDGPLAAPDAPAATAPATPPKHAKPDKHAKPKKTHHAAAKPPASDAFGVPAPGAAASEAEPPARRSVADDPLSLGMKWNGNNDSVAQTRSQNLDGNSFGSGAEVGMKLHF